MVNDTIKLLRAKSYYGPYVMIYGVSGPKSDAPLTTPDAVMAEVWSGGLKHGEQAIIQATPDVVRMVVGVDVTLMQWDDGWKVACMIVPQVRQDQHGNVGIAVKLEPCSISRS